MGAKAPSKLKLRRPQYKCPSCSKKFLSTQALKSHQYCLHKIKKPTKPVKEKIIIPTANVKLSNLLGKSVKKDQNSTANSEESAPNKLIASNKDEDVSPERSPDTRRIEFECPQCLKMFTVYLSAFKHIQKMHCINNKGARVDPNSPDMIKPVLVEICTQCNRRVREKEYHTCSVPSLEDVKFVALNCICSGCKQQFLSIQLFDMHVTGLHCDGIVSMFFPTMNEFLKWKTDMELETHAKYLTLNKCTSKHTLRCTYFLNAVEKADSHGNPHLCPSSIVIKEYSKGVQVHFYKKHYGHPAPAYSVPIKYAKYNITSMMDDIKEEIDKSSDKDLYVQFKTIMDNMVEDAAKLKISDLKILMAKALDLAKLVKQYAAKDDDESIKPSPQIGTISDAEITKALEAYSKQNKERRVKEKLSAIISDKPDNDSPALADFRSRPRRTPRVSIERIKTPTIVHTFSLAGELSEKMVTTKTPEPPKVEIPPKISLNVTPPSSITSYNDTYREFIQKNFMPKNKLNPSNTNSKIKVLSKKDINEKVINLNSLNTDKNSLTPDKNSLTPDKNSLTPDKNNLTADINDSPILVYSDESKLINQQPTTLVTKNYLNVTKPIKKTYTTNNNTKTDTPKPNILKTKANSTQKVNAGPNILKTKANSTQKVNAGSNILKTKANGTKKVNAGPNILKTKANSTQKVNAGPDILNTKANSTQKVKAGPNILKAKAKSQKVNVGNKSRKDTKKKVVKTKIGQFKPSLSPKKPTEANTSFNTSYNKIKPDFNYEVMEQENDCNILILKI